MTQLGCFGANCTAFSEKPRFLTFNFDGWFEDELNVKAAFEFGATLFLRPFYAAVVDVPVLVIP